jgi:hypothetical protein
MRFVYLDESGVGSPEREPYLIVAGVIVNADKQLKRVEARLLELMEKYVPPEKREGFHFHAKVLANGETGGVFDRKTYPEAKRLQALQELCEIPRDFDLPVVCHTVDRLRMIKDHPADSIADVTTLGQSACSIACLVDVDRYMRTVEDQSEVATIVYEHTEKARKHIREVHNFLRKKTIRVGNFAAEGPLTKIAETAFFALKEDSSLLQVSDAIAFTINAGCRKKPGIERFFTPFVPKIVVVRDVKVIA